MQNTGLKDKADSIEFLILELSFSEPLKTKNIANFLTEPYPKPLRAGLELRPFQIFGCNFGTLSAKDPEKSGSKKTEKRIYFSLKTNNCNSNPVICHSCEYSPIGDT
jgi:hypothetical protein